MENRTCKFNGYNEFKRLLSIKCVSCVTFLYVNCNCRLQVCVCFNFAHCQSLKLVEILRWRQAFLVSSQVCQDGCTRCCTSDADWLVREWVFLFFFLNPNYTAASQGKEGTGSVEMKSERWREEQVMKGWTDGKRWRKMEREREEATGQMSRCLSCWLLHQSKFSAVAFNLEEEDGFDLFGEWGEAAAGASGKIEAKTAESREANERQAKRAKFILSRLLRKGKSLPSNMRVKSWARKCSLSQLRREWRGRERERMQEDGEWINWKKKQKEGEEAWVNGETNWML